MPCKHLFRAVELVTPGGHLKLNGSQEISSPINLPEEISISSWFNKIAFITSTRGKQSIFSFKTNYATLKLNISGIHFWNIPIISISPRTTAIIHLRNCQVHKSSKPIFKLINIHAVMLHVSNSFFSNSEHVILLLQRQDHTGGSNEIMFINSTVTQGKGVYLRHSDKMRITVVNCSFDNLTRPIKMLNIGPIHSTIDIYLSKFGSKYSRDASVISIENYLSFSVRNSTFNSSGPITLKGINSSYIDSCTFINNVSEKGGTVVLKDIFTSIIKDCLFDKNTATSYGGCLNMFRINTSTITGCYFANNKARKNGGSIRIYSVGTSIIQFSNFVNNTAPNSAALIIQSAKTSIINNTRFTTNKGILFGIVISNNVDTSMIYSSIFFGNEGGAMYSRNVSRSVITNCTFTSQQPC